MNTDKYELPQLPMQYEARIFGLDVTDRDTWHELPEAFVRKLLHREGFGWERAHQVFAAGEALKLQNCVLRRHITQEITP